MVFPYKICENTQNINVKRIKIFNIKYLSLNECSSLTVKKHYGRRSYIQILTEYIYIILLFQ